MANADEELAALSTINTAEQAVVDTRYADLIPDFTMDSFASIQLTDYKANHLIYTANCTQDQLAVFSEIFMIKVGMHILTGIGSAFQS